MRSKLAQFWSLFLERAPDSLQIAPVLQGRAGDLATGPEQAALPCSVTPLPEICSSGPPTVLAIE